ncbi:hypothetical protein J8TS2_41740 [Lederbergia ruris]|uniref:Uncharacterized protein n=1 Tax=Lederbergia ruris TaxID=217495 RepID=A0ABQ4KPK1_9BACI|nr:hypothetical protein J8TS2_41740 [Lederbergia ruris]
MRDILFGAWLSPAYTSGGAQRLFYPPNSCNTKRLWRDNKG